MKRLALALCLVAVGCLDWEAARTEGRARADAGSSGGGSSAVGGGDAGGSAVGGGGGNAMGGGSALGGGGEAMGGGSATGGGGVVDAGCPSAFCFVEARPAGRASWGLVVRSVDDLASCAEAASANLQLMRLQPSTGAWTVGAETTVQVGHLEMIGIDPGDVWLVSAAQIVHFENGSETDSTVTCSLTGGTFWNGGVAASKDEAWFVGSNAAVCHWRRGVGFEGLPRFDNNLELTAVAMAEGQPLVAESAGSFYRVDGGLEASSQWTMAEDTIRMTTAPDGTLYALGDGRMVAKRNSNGAWVLLPNVNASALTNLSIKAFAADDVWVGGRNLLKRFNGTSWLDMRASLPNWPTNTVSVLAIGGASRDELVLAVEQNLGAGAPNGFVLRYRRGP